MGEDCFCEMGWWGRSEECEVRQCEGVRKGDVRHEAEGGEDGCLRLEEEDALALVDSFRGEVARWVRVEFRGAGVRVDGPEGGGWRGEIGVDVYHATGG